MFRKFCRTNCRKFSQLSSLRESLKNEPIKVKCETTSNIAVIKYWGKENDELIIPMNDNISVTLDDLRTTTSIIASKELEENIIFLNGEKVDFSTRIQNLIDLAIDNGDFEGSDYFESKEEFEKDYKLFIESDNHFPTAAGLASSASGLSAIGFGISQILNIKDKKIQSMISRVGSGSSSRSIFGGWVKWIKGNDDSDTYSSYAEQLFDETHWDDMRIVILVVDDTVKKIKSSLGMKYSRENSKLLQERLKLLPERIERMEKAIEKKDSETFFKITIEDCEEFHDVCLDTSPTLEYRNANSMLIVDIIHCFNEVKGKVLAGYTFDAGANAIIFVEKDNQEELLRVIDHFLPLPNKEYKESNSKEIKAICKKCEEKIKLKQKSEEVIKRIIETKIGPGPKIIEY